MEKIFHGCPICKSDVRGDTNHKYYCQKCNILFNKKDLSVSKKHLRHIIKRKIITKIDTELFKKIYSKNQGEKIGK